MQVIDILLIDDEKEYCQSLRSRFLSIGEDSDLNIQVKGFQNLEEGFAELEKDSKYKAVILDAKALIKTDQETADLDFLPVALHRLEKLNQKTGRIHTPFAVITGYYDNFLSFDTLIKEQKGKLFDKSSQEEEMLEYLLKEIENAENTKIEKQYADVFESVEKYLPTNPTDFRKKLINILKDFENPVENDSVLKEVRVIQDELYKILRQKNSAIIPNGSFADKNKHLDGNEQWNQNQQKKLPTTTVYQTPALSYLASSIFKICSSFGNHSTSKPTNVNVEYWELPSNYAVKSVVFSLLEQLIWFKKLMEKP